MNFVLIFCFAFVTIATSKKTCYWSSCYAVTDSGKNICGKNDAQYSGNTKRGGCGFFQERVECCKDDQIECFWSGCEGLTVKGKNICRKKGAQYSGATKKDGCGWTTEKVQCCIDHSKVCKWTPCGDPLRSGQFHCDSYALGKYTGETSAEDCDEMYREKHECCRDKK